MKRPQTDHHRRHPWTYEKRVREKPVPPVVEAKPSPPLPDIDWDAIWAIKVPWNYSVYCVQ